MRVDTLTTDLAEAYESFVQGREAGLFYHGLRYRDFLKRLLGCEEHYLLATDGGAVRGVLPLLVADGPRGRVINSLPYYGSNGGILADDRRAVAALVEAYNALATADGVLSATVIGNPFAADDLAAEVGHTHTDRRRGQFTALDCESASREAMMGRIAPAARRNVRKAAREGVTVRTDAGCLDRLRQMHQEGMAAIGGMAKSDRFFELVGEHFEAGREFDVYVAELRGQVIAALLVLYYNGTVEYFTPASDPELRAVQPLAAILIAALADAAGQGFRRWNWGGSWTNMTGVYRFKRKWAAEERTYHYYTQLNDAGVLDWSSEAILAAYPSFYVVPFSALNRRESDER